MTLCPINIKYSIPEGLSLLKSLCKCSLQLDFQSKMQREFGNYQNFIPE